MADYYNTFPRNSKSGSGRRHSLSSSESSIARPLLTHDSDDSESYFYNSETYPISRSRTAGSTNGHRYQYPYWKVDEDEEETEALRLFRTTSTYVTYNAFLFDQAGESAEYLPDVGFRPWLAAIGGFSAQFCSFGYMNVIGVFQTYYENNQLAGYSPSTISWIGSIQTFILAMGGLFAGRMCDMYGPRWLTIPGTILLTVGVCTTAVCTEYYQFILAQGVCSALGASLLFYATTAAVTTWFSVHRGLAFGVAASGASFGGITLPFLFDSVVNRSGFEAAVFSVGALLFLFAAITAAVTTMRIAPSGRQPYRFVHFYLKPYLDPVFALVTLSLTLTYLGLFVPFAFIASHALASGLSITSAFRLVAYLNAGSFAGRLFSGIASDYIGKFSVFCLVSLMSGLVAFPCWFFAIDEARIIIVSIAYGFASGGVLAMYPALVAQISPVTEIGTRLGSLSAAIAFGALASLPIAGALVGAGGEENGAQAFGKMQIYAGVVMMAGAGMAVLSKARATRGNLFAKE
ncbi:major facilitator superfamily domain-containing protein [Lipomyces oligophaga]|uniref:major facilitator superfamily domain-containing protein n=1 Tax=Lipomyces oligophaga TaxID=45792 RepID=UPI0034CFFBED